MTATWYLARHIPDLRRREPRNVGVILRSPDGTWSSRFLGETADGSIDGRKLRRSQMSVEAYKTWVDYFRRKASDDGWPDVERLQRKRAGNYFAEPGGTIFESSLGLHTLLQQLFSELVLVDAPEKLDRESPQAYISAKIEKILSVVKIPVIRNTEVRAIFDGRETTVPFGYEYHNGQLHLMDALHRHVRFDQAAADARELRSRVQAVQAADSAQNFFSFYASSLLRSSDIEKILYPVEQLSYTLDVDDEGAAVETLRHGVASR